MKYIKTFDQVTIEDISLVGGKNASLGQMIRELSSVDIHVPNGFAVVARAYWYHIDANNLREKMHTIMAQRTDLNDTMQLQNASMQIRQLIESADFPNDLTDEIIMAYDQLGTERVVAVRSSATAEDLPTASFAGQQETFLHVKGKEQLLYSCKKSMSSLFTPRAIAYREAQGFDHFSVALSVGVQHMVLADNASAGVAFSIDTEVGFKDVVMIESAWGLGETVVKGAVIPDLFVTHKPTIEKGYASIIKKQLGQKEHKIIFTKKEVQTVATTKQEQDRFSLSDEYIIALSKAVIAIEKHYSKKKGSWVPVDVEWAVDGNDNQLYILQARPETIHSVKKELSFTVYTLRNSEKANNSIVLQGQSIGSQIVCGTVRLVKSVAEIDQVQKGDIIVTTMTDPDWVPAMRKAAAIITQRGGRTCHAAIVAREMSVPAIVGAQTALTVLHTGQEITVDCSQGAVGYVYDGRYAFEKKDITVEKNVSIGADIMVNIADPERAFSLASLPVAGVGLARLEFIIAHHIGIHPRACLALKHISDDAIRNEIIFQARAYADNVQDFFIEQLSCGIGMIAAAFYPKPVYVRFSDFKTNEYRNLLGGKYFEPQEENPMLGWRGASRYYHPDYKDAFALECKAFKRARETLGFENIHAMIPFVRTLAEAKQVTQLLHENGLVREEKGLCYIMMCELPANAVLIEQFAHYFDGFSIGSNDLTQFVLGIDRDSEIVAPLFDEQNEAVMTFIKQIITGAKKQHKFISICGQGVSAKPPFADALIQEGISSLSLNPDAVLSYLQQVALTFQKKDKQ